MSGDGHVGDAVLYDADDELVAVAAPFLRAGLTDGDVVLLVCADHRRELLSDAVGGDPRLVVRPVPDVWRRPVEAMTDYQHLIEEQVAAGRALRIVADADFGPDPVAWSEWARFETVSHHATTPYPVRSLCVLDRRHAPAQVVDAVARTHPFLWIGGRRVASTGWTGPAENVRQDGYVRSDPLERAPATLHVELTGAADLVQLRRALRAELTRVAVAPWQVHEFVLSVGEAASNAIRHGRPPAAVRLFVTARRLLCTVTDAGAGFSFPLSSYLSPDPARSGMGLYLIRQLCDQVNVSWTPHGFTVRLSLVVSG